MTIRLIVSLALIQSTTSVFALDPPAMEWHKGYGSDAGDHPYFVMQTRDGGYVMTGESNSRQGSNILIVKTDPDGALEWQKTLGGDGRDLGNYMCETVYGNLLFAGAIDDNRALVKLSREGEVLWEKSYPGEGRDAIEGIELTRDGGIVATGYMNGERTSFIVHDGQGFLMKLNAEGAIEWDKTFGQPRGYDPQWIRDECYGVRQTPDGGYIMCGGNGDETRDFLQDGSPYGPSDIWQVYLVKTDERGNLEWESCYGSTTAHDAGEYLGLTRDGGYIIAVDADSAGEMRPNNFGFMKIAPDPSGR